MGGAYVEEKMGGSRRAGGPAGGRASLRASEGVAVGLGREAWARTLSPGLLTTFLPAPAAGGGGGCSWGAVLAPVGVIVAGGGGAGIS